MTIFVGMSCVHVYITSSACTHSVVVKCLYVADYLVPASTATLCPGVVNKVEYGMTTQQLMNMYYRNTPTLYVHRHKAISSG